MNFKNVFFTFVLLMTFTANAQEEKEFKPSGKVFFNIYSNFHADLSKDATQKTAFELKRAYLGYKYKFSEHISAKVTLDVGNNNEGSSYTAYLKAAQLDWKVTPSIKLSMGLIGMKQFKVQEKFWGYRYIFKSFQDQNKFGSSADLGINTEFKINKNLTANFTISNGEGYKELQDVNGKQKIGGNIVYNNNGLTAKIYADSQPAINSDAITTFSVFAGYKTSKWRLGAEYNKMSNAKKYSNPAQDYELDGFSFYSTYTINKKIEIFGRFDQLNSNTLDGETITWNLSKNGSQLITGIQVAPIKGLKFSLNYQNYNSEDTSLNNRSLIYINAQFKL